MKIRCDLTRNAVAVIDIAYVELRQSRDAGENREPRTIPWNLI